MSKVKFPKVPEKISMVWRDSDMYVALVDKKEFIKLYYWDGISTNWNWSDIFEKVK